MNEFGGNWTSEKIEIFLKYVPAYLTVMHNTIQKQAFAKDWKLMFFDGFAGSGGIIQDSNTTTLEGVATRVLAIDTPRLFDIYRFVEKNKNNAENLKTVIDNKFPLHKDRVKIYQDDFNEVVSKMVEFLSEYKNYKTLAFIDPFGMSVNWSSIEHLKGLSIDMWILVPTGIGVNRLLKTDANIDEAWLKKLQNFLGLSEDEIRKAFYKIEKTVDLFGENEAIKKQENAIEIAHALYKEKLKSVFKNVSDSYVMRNSQNSILYHFLLASNNKVAIKIANDIVGKGIAKL
jgi:three-Cys-motif partner protein